MVLGAGLPIYGGRRTGAVSAPSMLRVDYDRWGQTPEDLRQLATSAAHRRTRERFLALCRETIRRALHRLELSWKKARKLLGRADPQRRAAFLERLRSLLQDARHDRHRLVYLDE